ncbi:putative L-cysteine desulfhydrase, chloroplastic [Bulinus truncatus]|nr:putative L-cysteine desulfhydrase, chloroplastic [Bulinus truncatus]
MDYPGSIALAYDLIIDGLGNLQFGKEIREKEFLLDPEIAFINHGSYGTVPKRILDIQTKYNFEREKHPDFWFRFNCKKYVDQSRQAVADFINADVENVLLVSNATTAINTVVRSFPFNAGDGILDTCLTYGSMFKLCKDFTSRLRPDVERVNLQIDFPIASEEEIIARFEEIFQKHPNIKVAIIDHITSPTSIVLPVKKLVDLCHSNNILAVVDGAHAIGQLPLDMKELGADVYTSNVHKWGYAPRGSAVLWFDGKHVDWINPPNTSWKIGETLDFQFFDQGTRDHVPLICARHGLEFYRAVGGMSKVVQYTSTLADEVKDLLFKELGLEPLPIPPSLEAPNMRLVKLPALAKYPGTDDGAVALQKAIFGGTNVFGVLVLVNTDIYLRYSVQIYNELEDFKQFIDIYKKFLQNYAD